MSLPAPRRRPATAVLAAVVLSLNWAGGVAVAATQSTSAVVAATAVADLETTVLRIAGPTVSGGSVIATGTSLSPVRLTTSDPETFAGDATTLVARISFPRSAAEDATFRIDGIIVARSVPDLRGTVLRTDHGDVPAAVFTAKGVSYAIPRLNVPVTAVSRTQAPSAVGTATFSSLVTYEYGLLPVGARPRGGATFQESRYGVNVTGAGTARYTVYDADSIRGNADAVGEELLLADLGGQPSTRVPFRLVTPGTDVVVTVALRSGTFPTVRGVRYVANLSYGQTVTTWALDRSALATAGATVDDVTSVVSYASSPNALTWHDLGFDLS